MDRPFVDDLPIDGESSTDSYSQQQLSSKSSFTLPEDRRYFLIDVGVRQISTALEYVQETERDFAYGSTTPDTAALQKQLRGALQVIETLHIDFGDKIADVTKDDGQHHLMAMRIDGPELYDDAMKTFVAAMDAFEEYSKQHIELLRSGVVPLE